MIDNIDTKATGKAEYRYWLVVNNRTGDARQVLALSWIEAIWLCNWRSEDCSARLANTAV